MNVIHFLRTSAKYTPPWVYIKGTNGITGVHLLRTGLHQLGNQDQNQVLVSCVSLTLIPIPTPVPTTSTTMYAGSQHPIAVPAVAKTAPVTAQPKAETMKMETFAPQHEVTHDHDHDHNKAQRLRGGGAAKDCFIGMIGCFLCFECCEGCCDCIGNIICCPCETCC